MPYIALSIVIVLWSSSFVGIAQVIGHFTPWEFNLFRFLIATCTMGIFTLIYSGVTRKKLRILDIKDIPLLLLCSILLIIIYNVGLSYGEISTSPNVAGFIISQQPVITIILVIITGSQRLTPRISLGIILGILGSILTIFTDSTTLSFNSSSLFIVAAVLGESVYFLIAEKLLDKYTPLELNLYVNTLGTIMLIPTFPSLLHDIHFASTYDVAIIAYLGIVTGAMANLLWSYCLHTLGVSTSANALYLLPFLVILLNFIFRGQTPILANIICGLISLIGAYLVERSSKI